MMTAVDERGFKASKLFLSATPAELALVVLEKNQWSFSNADGVENSPYPLTKHGCFA